MSESDNQSRFDKCQANGTVKVVPMDAMDYIKFSETSNIGTKDLSGCHTIVITSPLAAILAHIPPHPDPRPPYENDPEAGKNYVRLLMNQMLRLHQNLKESGLFPDDAKAYVVCAVDEDSSVTLTHQVKLIHQCLDYVKLVPETFCYPIPPDRTKIGQGTVLVMKPEADGMSPEVFIEDVPSHLVGKVVSKSHPESQII